MGRTGKKRGVHRQRAELLLRQEVYLLVQKGRAALRRGHLADAEEAFGKALEIEPFNRPSLTGIGEVHARRSEHAKACEYLERALDSGERTEHLLYALANACRGAQRREKAFKFYEQLVALNPSNVRGLTRLGDALLERKDFQRADDLFRQALALEPHNLFALRGLGAALRGRREYRESIPILEQLLRLSPEDVRVVLRLAEAYAHEGDPGSARRAYLLALQIDPENHFAKSGLARLG
jgi:tetratricopeptide (TPR) repeat protein